MPTEMNSLDKIIKVVALLIESTAQTVCTIDDYWEDIFEDDCEWTIFAEYLDKNLGFSIPDDKDPMEFVTSNFEKPYDLCEHIKEVLDKRFGTKYPNRSIN